jgi:hypothetical protein
MYSALTSHGYSKSIKAVRRQRNLGLIFQMLKNANWSDLYLCRNVNYAWKIFQEIFMSILDDIAPTKEIKIKQKTQP